ncbi:MULTISPECIES: DUF7019 family protein [unclassified Streptomyces]|uniref:DUF7019 family protein n=1 Tax=unclassified Streptomyces TaxID=2593676 RepID=UPI00364C9411
MPRRAGRTGNSPPPHYAYISPSGPAVLVPTASKLRRCLLETRIKMAAAIPGQGDSTGLRTDTAKAAALGGYLGRGPQRVGTAAEPGLYVRDTAVLRHAVLRDYVAEPAVFAGVVGGVKPALIGSPDGLLQAPGEAATGHDLGYHLLQYMRQDADRAAARREEWPGPSYAAAVDSMLEPGVLPASGARMEFLAEPLFHSHGVLVAPHLRRPPHEPAGPGCRQLTMDG